MRKFIYIAFILAAVVAVYVYSEYNRAPETAEDKKSDYTLSVNEFVDEFLTDAAAADNKYKNKTIELTGVVEEININGNNTDVLLKSNDPMTSINVQLASDNLQASSLQAGKEAALKAIYVGVLTELGTDIELNQGIVLNTKH